jgi:hypothetical protein
MDSLPAGRQGTITPLQAVNYFSKKIGLIKEGETVTEK